MYVLTFYGLSSKGPNAKCVCEHELGRETPENNELLLNCRSIALNEFVLSTENHVSPCLAFSYIFTRDAGSQIERF